MLEMRSSQPVTLDLSAALADIVGAEHVRHDPDELARYAVDGIVPQAVVSPASPEEVSQVLALADGIGAGVIPRGRGTKMGLGAIPRRADLVLSLARLNRIVEHDALNLTVTAQAGVRLADLQERLARADQFLPLDPPYAEATVGGVVAANASGPRRLGYGTARDLVLGLKAVLPDGTLIRAGGQVMKNVAGYDLVKLFIGSLGTLGLITEVTFRLFARPEADKTFLVSRLGELDEAVSLALRLLDLKLQPSALEVISPEEGDYSVGVRVEGATEAVEWQIREMGRVCREGAGGGVEVLEGEGQSRWWRFGEESRISHPVVCKVSVVISEVGRAMGGAREEAREQGLPCALQAHVGSGIVYACLAEASPERLAQTIEGLRVQAIRLGGHLVVESAPPSVKERVSVWGPPRADWPVMAALKAQFDPYGILNPGRFVGGI